MMNADVRRSLRRGRHAVAGVLAAAAVMLSHSSASRAAAPAQAKPCLTAIVSGQGALIVCEWPTWLSEREKADVKRITRDMVRDAHCVIRISIERRLVEDALKRPESIFVAPAQPVACEIATQERSIPITATFAPRIVFKDSRAVDGSPNLANVEGVNSYLAWPVVEYVNRSSSVREEMLRQINLFKERLVPDQPFQGAAGSRRAGTPRIAAVTTR